MHEVSRSNSVDEDLLQIWLHIAQDDAAAADRQLDRIEERCRLHATQPETGTLRPDLGENVRCFSVDQYVVFYRPHAEGIVLLMVLHGSRDVSPLFRSRYPR